MRQQQKKQIPLSSVNGSVEVLMNSGFSVFLTAWENNPTLVSSRNDIEERARKFHTDDVLLPRSDRLKQISLAARPIRSTTKIWVVTRHQYGI